MLKLIHIISDNRGIPLFILYNENVSFHEKLWQVNPVDLVEDTKDWQNIYEIFCFVITY